MYGAAVALSGVQIVEVGQGGIFTARDLEAAIKTIAGSARSMGVEVEGA